MRFILRGAAIGLLAGALFFFVPFLFRFFLFFLFFLLISFIIRLIRGGRRGQRRGFGPGYRHFDRFADRYDGNPLSIDGSGYRPPVKGSGRESNYPVL